MNFLSGLSLDNMISLVRATMAMQIETSFNERRNLINHLLASGAIKISSGAIDSDEFNRSKYSNDDQGLILELRRGGKVSITHALADLLFNTCHNFRLDPNVVVVIHSAILSHK